MSSNFLRIILLISAIFFTLHSTGQTKKRYSYDLKLENSPSKFTATSNSEISENCIKIYVNDFRDQEIPFSKVRILSNNLDKILQTDASGYLYIPLTSTNFKIIISTPAHNDLVIDSLTVPNSGTIILKTKLTFTMAHNICSVKSIKKLTAMEIKEIAKKYSANPFDPEIQKNKTYFIICQL